MEAIEEYPTQSTIENESPCVENSATPMVGIVEDDFLKSNGVTETDVVDSCSAPNVEVAAEKVLEIEGSVAVNEIVSEELPSADSVNVTEPQAPQASEIIAEALVDAMTEPEFIIDTIIESESDGVTLKTEVTVETNDSNGEVNQLQYVQENSNNILNEIGQSIEFGEVLCSADTTENIENNNSTRQELFNKEELLDILEGNDDIPVAENELVITSELDTKSRQELETQIALNQLTRLKKTRKPRNKPEKPKRKRKQSSISVTVNKSEEHTDENADQNITAEQVTDENLEKSIDSSQNVSMDSSQSNDNIVNTLVKDWEDDDHMGDESGDTEKNCGDSNKIVNAEETQEAGVPEEGQGDDDHTTLMETSCEGDVNNVNKGGDESHPHKRQGRVIKKKVIFDPDNPDTFTKGKVVNKTKESVTEKPKVVAKPKEPVTEKEPSPKKIKTEEKQRSKSKSPASMAKMPWKKPPPKNLNKQNKRLSEVDKLLMDEGAVNMIYQLTPEAPKGRKNMRTKAAFIKKLQSSTPEGKEMRCRERKKEKSEEEAKKILGGKQRMSLSSSVKSPSMSEDFEAQCPDDSIIYRRHSSSSYSSSCMSPRRLSDVETSALQNAARSAQPTTELITANNIKDQDFIEDLANAPTSEIIKKEDCLTIKEKLNNKLSQVLNKRKRETSKEKSSKQKRVAKNENKDVPSSYLTVSYEQSLAEICINKKGCVTTVQFLKELELALDVVDKKKDICVTLITSETGSLCSGMSWRQLLDSNMEKRTNYAHEIAESARSMLTAVERHSKMLVTGVWAGCSDLALALVALSDVAVAAEDATFSLSRDAPPAPGVAVLTSRCGQISNALVNELVVFKRVLSASEAKSGGLISRTVWPLNARERIKDIARDIASQPIQGVLLKKQMLNLRNRGEREQHFQTSLEAERDLLVQYWTSLECQDALNVSLTGS